MAIIPELVPTEALQSANALSQGGTQLATLLGPALGGLLVALAGPSIAFWVDSASFAVSALTLASIRRRSLPAVREASEGVGAAKEPLMRLRALFAAEPVLLVMLVVTLAANLGAGGMSEVALPDLVYRVLHSGARGYGFLIAALGAGGLIGAIVAAQARRPRRPAVVSSLAFLAAGAGIFALSLARTLPEAIALVGILGLPLAVGNVLMAAAMQAWAPPHLLGRLMSVLMLTSFGAFPISVLVAGFVVRSFGPASFFVFTGVTLAIAVSFALALPSWRRFATVPIRDPSPPADPEPFANN
jgi:predicted MFS family arabinose efflux permease